MSDTPYDPEARPEPARDAEGPVPDPTSIDSGPGGFPQDGSPDLPDLLAFDAAEPAAAPPELERPPPREGSGSLVFFKDNLEAFAIAIVMALVIKHFCVEAFKIPTGSMEPTLIGENHNSIPGDGDRILVEKLVYLFRAPRRWEIPVFRYPLDRARNFIKRIAGLPGEHLRIYGGDLWVKRADDADAPFRIARKDRAVRNALYFAVYPPLDTGDVDSLPSALWRTEGPDHAWEFAGAADFAYVGGPAASIVLKDPIHKSSIADGWPRYGNWGEFARDVRIRATVQKGTPRAATLGAESAPTRVTLSWSPDGEWRVSLTLSAEAGGSEAVLSRNGQAWKPAVPLSAVLSSNHATDVELEFIDGDMRVWIDGEEVAVVPDDRQIKESLPSGRNQKLAIEAEGGPLTVRGVSIARDLFYINSFKERPDWNTDGLVIPEGAYFMLGDNTESSSDSRKWQVRTIYLRDGTEIQFDDGEQPEYFATDRSRKYVTDVNGVRRTWYEDDEDTQRGSGVQNAPFVWRDLIVGRAFLTFWPLEPNLPGRLHFID